MASLNQLKRTTRRAKQRVGRGQSSGRGKTAGRGTKGQNARSGRKKRPELRDIIKKIPKRRGWGKNRGRTVVGDRRDAFPLSLARLEALFESGAEVSEKSLAEKGFSGASIKIVGHSAADGQGGLTKRLSIKGIQVSASARAAIEKAGGSIL